jgi:hypothetical protein
MVGEALTGADSAAARAETLSAVANALRSAPRSELPPPLQIFPEDPARDALRLARRFRDELAALGGETRFVPQEEDLPNAVDAFVRERGLGPATDGTAAEYALLEAHALIADCGAALVVLHDVANRLAPYLPRTCIITAPARALHEHLSQDALAPLFACARSRQVGEAVLIAGPSRTADIEKVLVLGAHGPRHLTVFITGVRETAG